MKNILLWVGIAALALQDYFKKQPVKTTRQQQFLQTGETSQAFIEGIRDYKWYKKVFKKYIGKPDLQDDINLFSAWFINPVYINDIYGEYRFQLTVNVDTLSFTRNNLIVIRYDDNIYEGNFYLVIMAIFQELYYSTYNEDYKKLADIAEAGDWELALEIAKGQGLL